MIEKDGEIEHGHDDFLGEFEKNRGSVITEDD